MGTQTPLLKSLLQQRHWQTYRTFSTEYDKAARSVDIALVGQGPSRAQLYRWLSGTMKGLPHGDHCRVLEAMFPDWSAIQLFQSEGLPPTDLPSLGKVFLPQPRPQEPTGQFEGEFILTTPMTPNENPQLAVYSLSNPARDSLIYLDWQTFGIGVERLVKQIKNIGRRIDADACFGINEAGLIMATFLASAQFSRSPIGYLKCNKVRDGISLSEDSYFPTIRKNPTIVICDFEVKRADVIGYIVQEVRQRYIEPDLYFAVFGAMTDSEDPRIKSFDELTAATIIDKARFEAIFVATTMHPPGIEPPLELR